MQFRYIILLPLIMFFVSPVFIHGSDKIPKELPYYQTIYEKHVITVNLGLQASLRVSEFGDDL